MDFKNKGKESHFSKSGSVFAGLFLTVTILAGAVAVTSAQIADRIVANVNGEIILMSDLAEKAAILKNLSRSRTVNLPEDILQERNILQMIIDEKIMLFHATQSNISIKESEIDKAVEDMKSERGLTDKTLNMALKREDISLEKYRENLKNQMMIKQVTNFDMTGATITDDDVRDYYEMNVGQFMTEEKVRASHIVIKTSNSFDLAQLKRAKDKIESIKNEIKNGADFASLAKKYSEDPSGQNGGDLGWFTKGHMLPAIEQVAFDTGKGEVGGPAKTQHGLHLVKVTDRVEQQPVPFAKASGKIRAMLQQRAYQRKKAAWLERLRDQSYIEVLY